MTTRAWVAQGILILTVLLGAGVAKAGETVVRIIAESAEVRTGPGFAYRAIYVAQQGETLPALDRSSGDYWFRVQLPDGTFGWVLGDEVIPLQVDLGPAAPPSLASRVGGALFSPPPLLSGEVGLAFSAGSLGGEGVMLFRPSVQLAPSLALEAFVGETVGEQVDTYYYGAGANLFLWPASPVTPFFAMGAGGASGRKKADQFPIKPGHYATVNVGGGLLVALKKRITLRFDFRNHVLFDPNFTRELQEYTGGLAVVF